MGQRRMYNFLIVFLKVRASLNHNYTQETKEKYLREASALIIDSNQFSLAVTVNIMATFQLNKKAISHDKMLKHVRSR